jgi:large subunit ribosomal protein L15
MKIKKRKKPSRHRGSHTHGRGFKKKARGSGHRGGVGMSGTGKRGDQKKTLVLKLYGNKYFGKDRTLRRGKVPNQLDEINLNQLIDNLPAFIKKGIAKETKGVYKFNLKGYKILGFGSPTVKLNIKSSAASRSAIDKVKKMGGDIIIEKTQ